MFGQSKSHQLYFALLLCIHLVSTTNYNVALNMPTQLINGGTPYSLTELSKSNDGIVSYWEQWPPYYNWPNYLVVLIPGQTILFNFGSTKTIKSIYVCMRDQVIIQYNNFGINAKIFVGNDLSGGPSSTQNSLCATLSGNSDRNNVISQWISCEAIQGQYLWIQVPSSPFQLSEIMTYEYDFIQTNYLAVQSSSLAIAGNLYLPVTQQNYVFSFNSVWNSNSNSYSNYCFLTNNDATPYYKVIFKASIEMKAVALVALLQGNLNPPESAQFSDNILITIQNCLPSISTCTNVGQCSSIVDSSTNPESDCYGQVGNSVYVKGQSNSQLGINSLGILANCDCSKTSFLQAKMVTSYFKNVASLITTGQTYFTTYLNQAVAVIPVFDITTITDTISLVCGNASGTTYCGNRQLVIFDNDLNAVHSLSGSTLFSLSGNNLQILTSDSQYLGVHSFTLYVQLTNYVSLGYFPQTAKFTLEFVDPSQKYNVLLFTATQIFNPVTPQQFSQPSVANDGCVSFFEVFYTNWFTYLDALLQNQRQQFNMGSTKTVQSVFIALRDQQQVQYSQNNPIGGQIIIGNDTNSPFTPSNTLCGVITGSPFPRSQWISCVNGVTGKYLWLVNPHLSFLLTEIMAYQYYFVQVNGTLSVSASTNQANVMLAFQQSNPIVPYNSVPSTTTPGSYTNYCYLSSVESQPTITILLKAYINVLAVLLLSLNQASNPPNSALYSNKVTIQVFSYTSQSWVSCPTIINSNYNPESDCGGILANQIKLQRDCSISSCQLGTCGISILSDCDCTKTSFLSQMINAKYYVSPESLIVSGSKYVITSVGTDPVVLKIYNFQLLTDSVSQVCGDASGSTFCGVRQLVIWDSDANQQVILSQSSLLQWNSTLNQLTIQTNSSSDIGIHNFILMVNLYNYTSLGYFPEQTVFTVTVNPSSQPSSNQNSQNSTCFVQTYKPQQKEMIFQQYSETATIISINIVNYTQTPKCNYTVQALEIQQIDGVWIPLSRFSYKLPSTVNIQVAGLQQMLNNTQIKIRVASILNDSYQTQNSDLIISITFVSPQPDQNSTNVTNQTQISLQQQIIQYQAIQFPGVKILPYKLLPGQKIQLPYIRYISNDGQLIVVMPDNLLKPAPYQNHLQYQGVLNKDQFSTIMNQFGLDENAISIQIVSNQSDIDFRGFSYEFQAFQNNELHFYLNFTDPLQVSQGQDLLDQIQITFNRPHYFISSTTNQVLLNQSLTIYQYMPKQFDSQSSKIQIEKINQVLFICLIGVVFGVILAQLANISLLQRLWSAFLCLQIALVDYNENSQRYQANIAMIFNQLSLILELNVIPKNSLQNQIFGSQKENIIPSGGLLDSCFLFDFMLFICILLLIVTLLLWYAGKISKNFYSSVNKLKDIVCFGMLIKTVQAAQIIWALASFKAIRVSAQTISMDTQKYIDLGLGIFILITLIVHGLLALFLTHRYKESELNDTKVRISWGAVYLNLDVTRKTALFQATMLNLVRINIGFIICGVFQFSIKTALMFVVQTLQVCYILHVRPYYSPKSTRDNYQCYIELFNQVCLMILIFVNFLLTDFVNDNVIKFNIGWFQVIVICLIVFINLIYAVFDLILPLLKKLWLTQQKYKKLIKQQHQIMKSIKLVNMQIEMQVREIDRIYESQQKHGPDFEQAVQVIRMNHRKVGRMKNFSNNQRLLIDKSKTQISEISEIQEDLQESIESERVESIKSSHRPNYPKTQIQGNLKKYQPRRGLDTDSDNA